LHDGHEKVHFIAFFVKKQSILLDFWIFSLIL